jgi:uncharacterized protein involved in type VI secretion and phage assembly
MAKYFGKYRGTVLDNDDAETRRGKLKVRVESLLDDNAVWAMPCVPYAGNQLGWYFLPPPMTSVWVEFEEGDLNRPIWTGCYWEAGELPEEIQAPTTLMLKTANVTLTIDDTEAGGLTLSVLKDDKVITIAASGTGLTCTVGKATTPQLSLGAETVTLKVGDDGGSLSLDASSAGLAQASATVVAKDGSVALNGDGLKVGP